MLQLFFSFYGLIMLTFYKRMKTLNNTLKQLSMTSIIPIFLFFSMFFSKIEISDLNLLLYCESSILVTFLALQLFPKYDNYVLSIMTIVAISVISLYPNFIQSLYFSYFIILISFTLILFHHFKLDLKFYSIQIFLFLTIGEHLLIINSPNTINHPLFNYFLLLFFLLFYEIFSHWFTYEFEQSKRYKKLDEEFEEELRKEIKIRTWNIEKHNMALRETNKLDKMTEAYNKKATLSIINNLIDSKIQHKFSILMFDIDNFKSVNDTFGHIVGDQCIKFLAKTAMETIREEDCLGRFGGDEFLIVLPNLSLKDSFLVAERFKNQVSKNSDPHFTISIGLASFPNDGADTEELIHFADEGLYLSKSNGRNQISHKNN